MWQILQVHPHINTAYGEGKEFMKVLILQTKPDGINACQKNIEPQIKLETIDQERIAEISLDSETLSWIEDICMAWILPPHIDQSGVKHLLGLSDQSDAISTHFSWGLHNPDTPRTLLHLSNKSISSDLARDQIF